MRVLFIGDVDSNSGPANVHKELLANWPKRDCVRVINTAKNPAQRLVELCAQARWCDVAIMAGLGWADYIMHRFLGFFKVPVVIINHGYMPYENEINGHGFTERKVRAAKKDLDDAALVIANSRLQEQFLLREQPELSGKLAHVELGVNKFSQISKVSEYGKGKKRFTVAISGGDRAIKGNDVTVRAIKELIENGYNIKLEIFGDVDAGNYQFLNMMRDIPHIIRGQVSQDDFIGSLTDVDVFVMNSRHEPFGLSALDALRAGTSVLLSKNCGALEIMDATESDVINDCENVLEVAEKIAEVIEHPNSRRLYETIDFSQSSWSVVAKRFRNLCISLCCIDEGR